MRRRFALGATTFAVLAVGALVVLWFATRPAHRINPSSIEQIKAGMTLAEVEAILGVPAGDYSTRPVLTFGGIPNIVLAAPTTRIWTSNEASTRVFFDANDRVLGATYDLVFVTEESRWTRIRRWLRLE